MKIHFKSKSSKRALTLLEMTFVILVLLTLISVGILSTKKMDEWKQARKATEVLRSVYTAQRMYLADNPTALIASVTEASIISYLPNIGSTPATLAAYFGSNLPKSLDKVTLGFNFAVIPPRLTKGGVLYDPSGSSTDSLWDVGE